MKSIVIGPWNISVSEDEIIFPEWAVDNAVNFITRWLRVFPREQTWVVRQYAIPSLIIRLDCVIKDGKLVIYEIEDRPAGIGVSILASSVFAEKFKELKRLWPKFEAVISPRRNGSDDEVWLSIAKGPVNGSLVLVRAEPDEKEFHYLGPKSISTIITEGDKSYGVPLGLWTEVSSADELSWEKGFVLKPLRGSKCKNVELWSPGKKGGGISTKSRIIRVLEEQGKMFLQDFVAPMDCPNLQGFSMIYRFCFGFHPIKNAYVPLGGLWAARPNQKIHGAGDTIFGPLNF